MIFSSMQLADAILWYNGLKKNNINYITTSLLIPLILSIQILYNVYIKNNNKNTLINILVIVVILYMFYRFNGYSESIYFNKLASPVWGSKEIMFWELLIFIIFIMYPTIGGMLFSIIILFLIKLFIGGAYGSLWCFISNIIMFYYLYKY